MVMSVLFTMSSKALMLLSLIFILNVHPAHLDCRFATKQCPNEKIQFWFYKKETPDEPVLLHPFNLTGDLFEPERPLKILIHGFTGDRNDSPNVEVRPLLLKTQNVNVLSVDYGDLAEFPCFYPWAVANAPIVSECLAELINALVANDLVRSDDIHLIGFSLGAQIAGITANHLRKKLTRITGLDPVRPYFVTTNTLDKLDETDADFIDIIHTDPGFFGLLFSTGHADFYPNLEQVKQPGCDVVDDGRYRNCNHFRAPAYYAESIISSSGFWSYNCGTWYEFALGRCMNYSHKPNVQMGYFVSKEASGSYFLGTNPKPPYAKGPLVDFEFESVDKRRSFLKILSSFFNPQYNRKQNNQK